jgi:hypothetical protein
MMRTGRRCRQRHSQRCKITREKRVDQALLLLALL